MSLADRFPAADFALIGDEAIGKVVVDSIGKSPAVLLKKHGVFTIGKDAAAAVKAAVMTEDIAATVWLAMQIGQPETIPQEDVEKLHDRYTRCMANKKIGAGIKINGNQGGIVINLK